MRSVSIKTKVWFGLVLMQKLRICMGLVLMYLQLILTPYANERV